MDKNLYTHLISKVDISSIDALCSSISAVAPYVSTLAIQSEFLSERLTFYKLASNRRRAYTKFEIPKKSGGKRVILAPKKEIKQIQTTLNFILSSIYNPSSAAMGFINGKSVRDNAQLHIKKNYVFNIDLQDFFPSITARMVEHSLANMGIEPFVARLIAEVCTIPGDKPSSHRNYLPQGAPTSPVLSNIYCQVLDKRLTGLANRFLLTYSRYADDITFSSNHNIYQQDGEFWVELKHIIADCGFQINPSKTRLQKRGERQEVTGISVNEKTNVSRKYIKNLRALIHHIGHEQLSAHKVNIARGKLNYLRMIKGADDATYRTLCIKLNLALKGRHFLK